MNIQSVKLIYFSPTRTTKQVLEGIAEGMQAGKAEHLDLTPPAVKDQAFGEVHNGFVVIGAPVYGGRVAPEAVHRLRRLKANRTPAAFVVVYGNRAYEDALLELRDLIQEAGFMPVAGGAFVGEHSYSKEGAPIAKGRPDTADLKKAKEFGRLILQRMRDIHSLDEMPALQVPGNVPYKERKTRPKISPMTQESLCALCGTCAEVCPTGAVTVGDTVMTDPNECISCCACIKDCPTQARVFEEPTIMEAVERLRKNCRARKEPEIYLVE